jgi:hypothetical protein
MTRSARATSDWGSERRRALAVLRLMMKRNLVGCSMGRSAGFAPLRILSTDHIFQLLIHSRSLEPAGFMAVLVETTSMGLMVTKS